MLAKKQKGRPIMAAKRSQASNVVDLMNALLQS